jgi:hypothetical protein
MRNLVVWLALPLLAGVARADINLSFSFSSSASTLGTTKDTGPAFLLTGTIVAQLDTYIPGTYTAISGSGSLTIGTNTPIPVYLLPDLSIDPNTVTPPPDDDGYGAVTALESGNYTTAPFDDQLFLGVAPLLDSNGLFFQTNNANQPSTDQFGIEIFWSRYYVGQLDGTASPFDQYYTNSADHPTFTITTTATPEPSLAAPLTIMLMGVAGIAGICKKKLR